MLRVVLLIVIATASAAGLYAALRPEAPRSLASPASEVAAITTPAPMPPPRLETATRFERSRPALRTTALAQQIAPTLRTLRDADGATRPAREARRERLFNPMVVSAASIRAGDRDIRLAGIKAPRADALCGEGPEAWPCGTMARAALRRLVGGRAIECAVPQGASSIPDRTDCRVGGRDLAAWMVAQGWAAGEGARFADLEAKARQARLGLWGQGRPDVPSLLSASFPAARSGPAQGAGGLFTLQPTEAAAGLPAGISAGDASAPDSDAAIRPRVSGIP